MWGHILMLDGKAWLSVSALIHPKGVLLGWGQDSVQASQVHPHQTLSSTSLWTLLCALVHSHAGTGRGHPQTVPTKLGACNCPTSLGILKHSDFLSLDLRGKAQLLKNNPTPSSPLHQTLHLAQCSQTSIVLLATAKPRLVHQIDRWRSVIHQFREHVSTALESSGSVLYTTASDALHHTCTHASCIFVCFTSCTFITILQEQ